MVELGTGEWGKGYSKVGQGVEGLKRPSGNIGNNSNCPLEMAYKINYSTSTQWDNNATLKMNESASYVVISKIN